MFSCGLSKMTGLAESLEKRLQIGDSALSSPTPSALVTYRRLAANDRRLKNRDSGIGSDSGTAIMAASLSDSDSAASHLSVKGGGIRVSGLTDVCCQDGLAGGCRQHDSDSGGSYSSCEVRSAKR